MTPRRPASVETAGRAASPLHLVFERTIPLLDWGDTTRRKIMEYWKPSGMTFPRITDDLMVGGRGDIWGNMTSFDINRLQTWIEIRREGSDAIRCQMTVDTSFQVITAADREYWQRELDTLESYLLGEDLREAEWEAFRRRRFRETMQFMLTFGLSDRFRQRDSPAKNPPTDDTSE